MKKTLSITLALVVALAIFAGCTANPPKTTNTAMPSAAPTLVPSIPATPEAPLATPVVPDVSPNLPDASMSPAVPAPTASTAS